MEISERALRSIERIQEDERLRGDLEDRAATALVEWASALAVSIADDPTRSDSEVETAIQAIRSAARTASRSGESEPQQVIAAAEAITRKTYADILAVPAAPAADAPAASEPPANQSQPAADQTAVATAQAKPLKPLKKRRRPATSECEPAEPTPAEPAQAPTEQGLVHSLLERLSKPESQDS